ncbi:MAG: proprotein convertase P-domain-containing protein [Chloracidobacterium sp.]|nr:proprotein convertase P-domain-containing protein [Chloracidobacterium sp.]
MLRNQRSFRFSRVKGFAIFTVLLALLTAITTLGAGGSHLAFIDSATEFFGLQTKIAPIFSNEQTNAPITVSNKDESASSQVFAVTASLPNLTETPGNITIPLTVGDMTGEGIFAFDIQITFDPAVIQPTGSGIDNVGTLSSGASVSAGITNAGHIIISGFQATEFAGAGTLVNLKFTVQNNLGASTNLTFEDYTDPGSVFHPGFKFNEGTPVANTTNGSVAIPAATATSTATATDTPTATNTATATATETFTPTATATETFTPTATATETFTPTATATETFTPTATATETFTPTATATETFTPTETSTSTATSTATFTPTPSGPCGSGGNIEIDSTGYTTLTAAFAAINAGTHTGALTVLVCADSSEGTGTALLNASGGPSSYSTVLIRPFGGAARTISGTGTAGSPMINFDGADNVTIDGLNTGGDSLTISNSNTSTTANTSTIRYINDATSNTIQNATIRGAALGASTGTIFYSTTTGSTGNDNNTVTACNVGPVGASFPANGILSSGTTTTQATRNSGLVITNNNIFDFFTNTAVIANGFLASAGTTDATITGNSFYQTATRTMSVAASGFIGISIADTSSINNNVSNNFIGGSAASAGGTAWTQTGAVTHTFIGIRMSVGSATASSLQNNTITNLNISTSSTSTINAGISAVTGAFNIGTTTGNTIGATTGTGSITWTAAGANQFAGILTGTGTPNGINISNNKVGSITFAGAGTTTFYGIRFQGAATLAGYTVSNNLIGSTSTANSITSNANGAVVGVSGTQTLFPATVSNNTIQNLQSTSTGTSASLRGIELTGSVSGQSISGNTIANFSTTSTNTSANSGSALLGITFSGTATSGNTITTNTIRDMASTTSGATAVSNQGIYIASTPGTTISRNFIYNLTTASTSTTSVINGINLFNSSATINMFNNMMRLGLGVGNNPIIRGILDNSASASPTNILHNSIYIDGTQGANTVNTACISKAVASTMTVRNNILWNNRASTGAPGAGTGRHYGIQTTSGNPTSNYNDIYTPNNGGAVGFSTADRVTLTDWRTFTSQDLNSFNADPQFIDATNATTPDLHIHPTNVTVIEGNGTLVSPPTDDFDGQTRSGLTPVDIGADAGNFSGLDLTAPSISYTAFGNTSLVTNRTLAATITDAGGVAGGADSPRIYFKKSTDGSYVSTQCTGTYNCVVDYTLVGGGSVASGDIIQYFVVAQDTAGNLGSNPAAGFTGTNVNAVTTPPTTPNSYNIVVPFTGSYNVGTGETYTSLTNAGGIFAAINASLLSGNVTINITSDLTGETGTNALNQWSEEGVGNYTLTLKPSGAPRSITSTTGATGLITLNGADRVTIDGSTSGGTDRSLTLINANTTTSGTTVVGLFSSGIGAGATNNTIKNTIIQNGNKFEASTTSFNFGIYAGSGASATSADIDNLTIQNNLIQRCQYGIQAVGFTGGELNGLVIQDNTIGGAVLADYLGRFGILVGTANGATVTRNTLRNSLYTAAANGIGILASSGLVNSSITRNSISNLEASNSGGYGFSAITVATANASSNLTVANNFIYDIRGTGWTTGALSDTVAGIRVTGTTVGGVNIFNNSVNLFGSYAGSSGSATVSAALMVNGTTVTGLDIRNNSFANTFDNSAGTGDKSYAIFTSTANTMFTSINYNNYYVSGSAPGALGAINAVDATTLGALATASGGDANSISANPNYASNTDLHVVGAPLLNVGETIAAVTDDFDGDARPQGVAYEIGADENEPVSTPTSTNTSTPTNTATATNTATDTPTPTATAACTPAVFANATAVTIPGTGTGSSSGSTGSSYPSNITVSGMSGNVYKVTVKLNNLTHSWPGDIDMMLVGPDGTTNAVIMSDVTDVSGAGVTDISFTLDSDSANAMPPGLPVLTDGSTYSPTNHVTGDIFLAPAPAAGGSSLATFVGASPNGTWSLYISDDASGDTGTLAGGWEISITTDLCPTPTATDTATATATATETFTPTATATETFTPTSTATNTDTPTPTATSTETSTPTFTPTPFKFFVDTTADTLDATIGDGICADAGGFCSLRAAISESNFAPGANTISLPSGVYTTTLAGAAENVNASGDYDITSDVIINGAGSGTTIVEANAAPGVATERVFHIRGAAAATALNVNINNLTVRHGRNTINAFGGGIRIDQGTGHNITLDNLVVTANLNGSSGGGISISGSTSATVNISNCTISGNSAGSAAAGTSAIGAGVQINVLNATTNITNSTITGNTASSGLTTAGGTGAGLSSVGLLTTITNSTISNNTASVTVAGATVPAFTGGVHVTAGTTTITGSTISGNQALVTAGTGAAIVGGIYNQQATVNIISSTVTGNSTTNTVNPANAFHAGVRALAGTVATTTNITDSSISNNTANGTEGGGIVNFVTSTANATVNLTRSTVSGNAVGAGGAAGGIENVATSTGLATVNLLNSTVSGNSAADGAGIYNFGATATVNLDYSTVAANTATNEGGGLYRDTSGAINVISSVVGDNTAPLSPDIFGVITSLDYNHIEDLTGGTFVPSANDVTGIDAGLGALANNGGPTFTHLPGFPVANLIPSGVNGCGTTVAFDQRGAAFPRPFGAGCDKGSVELQNGVTPTATNTATPTGTATETATPTATATETSTSTPTATETSTPTATATETFTPTPTATETSTPTATATATETATNTATATPTAPAVINGTITYGNANGLPAPPRFISNVQVNGAGSPPVSAITDGVGPTAGQYSLTGFGAGSYTVTPSKTGGVNSAINSFDAGRIAQHVSALNFLTGNALVAADVSGNGNINSFDAAQIAAYVVALPPYGNAGQWRFFTIPSIPFPVGSTPTSRTYPSVSGTTNGEDYTGILVGEVSGNWVNTGARPASGPERQTAAALPRLVAPADGEVLIPVSVQGASNKGIIAYEFNLRYDPSVIQPQADPINVAGTVSRGLSVVANAAEPGLLKVAVYGAMPIDENGLLLNLRFTAVGAPGTVSPLTWEKLIFNEGDPQTLVTDGQIELSAAAPNQAEMTGRVVNSMGQGVANARVILTDITGASRSMVSDASGVYRFGGLQVGQTFTISVDARQSRFAPLTVSVTGQSVNVDMIAGQ